MTRVLDVRECVVQQAIRSGNYPVVIKDHVLILNWNRQTPPLLRQLALAFRESDEAEKHNSKLGLNARTRSPPSPLFTLIHVDLGQQGLNHDGPLHYIVTCCCIESPGQQEGQ